MNRIDRVFQEGSGVRIILISMCIVALLYYKYSRTWLSLPVLLVRLIMLLYLGNELKRAIASYFRKRKSRGVDLIDSDENM